MLHICYIYIYDYQCLHNVDITFDHRYNYSYNPDEAVLNISAPTKKLPEHFWGAGIWSLTGIVGNNGAGKTTVNRFLLEAVVEGLTTKDLNGVLVYENNDVLLVFHNNNRKSNGITINKSAEVKIKINPVKDGFTHLQGIDTFFYQGHFSAEFSSSNICTEEYSGLYNASEGFLIRKDFEMYGNATDFYLTCPISSYLVSHISQKHQRICRLLVNEELRSKISQLHFPRYIMFSPNRGGQNHIKYHPIAPKEIKEELTGLIDPPPIQGIVPNKEELIGMFVYFNLLNAISDQIISSDGPEIIKRWREAVDYKAEVMPQFQRFILSLQNETVKYNLQKIYDVLSFVFGLAQYDEYGGFYLDAVNERDKVERLMDEKILDTFYISSRFFDMHYSHNCSMGYNQLSSGEEICLNLYALLYDAIEIRPQKCSNIKSPRLIILDEAEIGFHPEWQRLFINTLLDFLHSQKVNAGHDYQVVITTHSPILLSDIPSCCCNFLKRIDENTIINLRGEIQESFASNVFKTYRNSFFLEEGMIGKYAESKLKALEEKCKKGDSRAADEIRLIGDERLQQYYESLLARSDNNAAIRYYQEQIRKLEKGADE